MNELSPEELLDQVAQQRAQQDTAMDQKDGTDPSPIPAAAAAAVTDEGDVFGEDEEKKKHPEQQPSLDKDWLETIKVAGSLESLTRRNASYSSPGAIEMAVNYYDTTSRGGRGGGLACGTVATTTDHEEETLDDPPIRAILVDNNNSDDEETAANSIYTAEPMGSIIFKDRPFYRKKWHLLIVGSCALGMLMIIAGSVAMAVTYDGSGDRSESNPQRQSPDFDLRLDERGGGYREYDDHENNSHDDRPYKTHHALIFGTNAQELLISDSADDSAIQVSVSCHDGADITLVDWSSDVINCQPLDSHTLDCAMPLRNRTLEFLTYDCIGNKPRRNELVTIVDLDISSLLDKGDAAYAHLIRFCAYPLDLGTKCQSSDPAIPPTEFLGACKITCPDGCDFQVLAYNSCREDRIDQNSNQGSNMVDAIRMNLTDAIFSP